jgi:hypothetical protein
LATLRQWDKEALSGAVEASFSFASVSFFALMNRTQKRYIVD